MFRLKSRFLIGNLCASCGLCSSSPKCHQLVPSHPANLYDGRHLSDVASVEKPPSVLNRQVPVLIEHKVMVKTCNKFNVKTRGVNVHVRPTELDVIETAFQTCAVSTRSGSVNLVPDDGLSNCNVQFEFDGGRNAISIFASNKRSSDVMSTLQLRIPHQSFVNIETMSVDDHDDVDVTLDPMELLDVSCWQSRGRFTARKLKCSSLRVFNSQRGHVNLEGSFTGKLDVELKGTGSIRGDLLRCSDVSLATDDGQIDVVTVYASSVAVVSLAGDVRLRTIRASCEMTLHRGDLSIGCLDGELIANVKCGNASVFMNDLNPDSNSSIVCEHGHARLAFSAKLVANLHLEGRELDFPETVNLSGITRDVSEKVKLFQGHVKKSESTPNCAVSVVTRTGTLTLRIQDWLQTVTANWK